MSSILCVLLVKIEFRDELGKERLSEGDSFGLKSLLFGTPLEYSAIAVTPVDAFTFSSAVFATALRNHPKTRAKIRATTYKKYKVMMYESDT